MLDWYAPRDKGPPIEEPVSRHKTGRGKKPWKIEYRYTGPIKYPWQVLKWQKWKCYKTEADRDKGWKHITRYRCNEYRLVDPE